MNIVFAFADDWGRYASCYYKNGLGSDVGKVIDTPNIDSVAEDGLIFSNAFVPAPSCTPCRSSVLSGRYFWQTGQGAILVGARWDESIPTYPLELEKSGYHIGYTYKVWSPGENPDAPYGGERNAYHTTRNFERFSHYVTERSGEIGIENAKQELYQEVRDNFKDFLSDRKNGQPFCYWWGPMNTHRTWEQGSGKNLWGINPDDLKGTMPKSLPDVHEVREDFADYLGETLAFDKGIGVLIEELKKAGEYDNTLFVISGDHGIPGMPRGKCNLYDMGCEVALIMRYPQAIKGGGIVDDIINIMDLAPTFLDLCDVSIPNGMTAKSLKPLLLGDDSTEPKRDFVIMGRERHVDVAREGYLPYPQRAIRTKDFLYIYNFEPDRWPMGDPCGLQDSNFEIDYDILKNKTFAAFPDVDASPTKAWIIHNRNDDRYSEFYTLGMGKRPREELYCINSDTDTVLNVITEHRHTADVLKEKLFAELKAQDDPRVTESDCRFEHLPFTVAVNKKG